MNGTWNGSDEAYGMFTYQVEKRATPTISTSSASDFNVVAESVAWRTATSISFSNSSPRSTQCNIVVASGGDSRGFGARIRINQSSGYVHIDAEL